MASESITDEYLTHESRLASFQKTSKKRGSSASGRGTKALNWPHKTISAESLARAGLFFNPSPENPDNVTCFLCHKGLDGWEANDNPLEEHLTHSPDCGWAIVAAIEAEVGNYALEDPNQASMKAARKATFAGRWPHDSQKGWKCKTKQLVDAGWKYTPTSDSDDMATCVYCQLALDGWEPNDKPLDEHYKRSPNCAFFALVEEAKTTKKSSRAKGSRASKASRLSIQSVATVASETTSIADTTTNPDDSVLTTASTMTQGGKKSRAKKTTAKGRKTKAKKEEAPEVHEIEASAVEEALVPKPARGRKRGSVAMDDSIMSTMEAHPPKKRATKASESTRIDDSVLENPDDSIMTDAPAPKKTGAKKKAAAPTRITSATSQASMASLRAPPEDFPDDDEIERQLEADLERPLSDDEDITADPESERLHAHMKKRQSTSSNKDESAPAKLSDYAMFAPVPAEADDAEVDEELRALQAEMEVEAPQPTASPAPEPESELKVPKKGKKAGTRKASKQTKAKKAKAAPEPVNDEQEEKEVPTQVSIPEPVAESVPEPELEQPAMDESMASTDTVIKKSAPSRPSIGKRGRGRPSKASLAAEKAQDELTEDIDLVEAPAETPELEAEKPVKRGRGRPSKASLASRNSTPLEDIKPEQTAPKRGRGRPSKKSLEARQSIGQDNSVVESQVAVEVETAPVDVPESEDKSVHHVSFEEPEALSILDENSSRPATSSSNQLPPMPLTPGHVISPAPSARQAAISPSPSPQSSDAENQPPSSKANTSIELRSGNRASTTPIQSSSPSKRNRIGGLQSEVPWDPVDLDAILGSPQKQGDKENGVSRFLKQGQGLTSPEKRMTVEEWIYYNASEAEKKLKHDCETMVGRFESEGTKAMRVLESLVVE